MRKAILIIFLILIILSVNSYAAQVNSTSYKQNVIVSVGGENPNSTSYKTNIAMGIINGIINSTSYINRLGFFHLLLLANDQPCTTDGQCEGGFCCSNLCSSSACSTSSSSSSSSSTSGGGGAAAGGGGGGGGAIPLPLEEKKEKTADFSIIPASIKDYVALGAAKTKPIKVRNTGDVELNFDLKVNTISEFVFLSEDSFSLSPGQEKEIELNIIGKKLGSYFGEIEISAGGIKKSADVVVEVESEQVLFDAKIDIPSAYKEVAPGDDLRAQITLLNVGPARKVDVTTTYIIKDKKGRVIDEFSETFAVEKQSSYAKSFRIPESLEPGDYIIIVELRYEKSFAVSSELFKVVEKQTFMESVSKLPISLPLLVVFAIGIILLLGYTLVPKDLMQRLRGKKKR